VRFWGVDWQLPAALYFDEMKYVAWAGEAKSDASASVTDLRNPTLYHHLLQAEYAVAALFHRDSTAQETAVFELRLARLTSAILGALACWLTGLAASAMVQAAGGVRALAFASKTRQPDLNRSDASQPPITSSELAGSSSDLTVGRDAAWAGFAAGLIVALAPLHVHMSHYATNDATASFFLAATLLFGARALAGGHWRDLLLAGAMAGLAFSTKYSFAVGILLPLVASVGSLISGAPSPSTPLSQGARGARRNLEGSSPSPVRPSRRSTGLGGEGLLHRLIVVLLVPLGFVVGAVLGAPEFVGSPAAVVAGVVEQSRLGAIRWNGQSDAPIWLLYIETLIQGLGWPALMVGLIGIVGLALRRPFVAVAGVIVPLGCLAVMLRQELFFARFALPLLSSLAILAGIGTVALARLGVVRSAAQPAWVAALTLAVLAVQLLPEVATTVRHDQLATMTDTRVLARRWLRQRLDGARVVTEVYGQPIAWAGNEQPRGYRLQRVPNFAETSTISRLVCDGNRFFIVASLTAERELARRGSRPQESGYDLLAREGRAVVAFDPYLPGMTAPAHPDNTGIPFWYLDRFARPGPNITIYELSSEMFPCPPGGR
jgi:hypothetical protein